MNNYGGILTIWDRLAGTLVRADTAPDERYGVPGEIDTYPQRFADAFRAPFRPASTPEPSEPARAGATPGRGRPATEEAFDRQVAPRPLVEVSRNERIDPWSADATRPIERSLSGHPHRARTASRSSAY